MASLPTVPLDMETVSNYYYLTADFIELASERICEFFIALQDMKEELRLLNPRQNPKMSDLQSLFRLTGADYIEWLDFQLSYLEGLFESISMSLELAHGVNQIRPRLTASKKGKIFARWLRDNPGIAENLGKEKDQNKHNSEAKEVQNEAKRQLREDEVSSPKGGKVPCSPSISSLVAVFLYTHNSEVYGKMLPQEAEGGAEQVQLIVANYVDLERHYLVRFAKNFADLKDQNKHNSEASEFENETESQLPDGAVELPKSDDDPLPPDTASLVSLFGYTGEDDGKLLPQESSDSSNQKLREWRAVTTAGNHSISHGGSDRKWNQNVKSSDSRKEEDEKKSPSIAECHRSTTTEESQPINTVSREISALYLVWVVAHKLLWLYHDHMRRAALVLFHLWENGIWLDDSDILKQMLAHLQRTCDIMEEELIEASNYLLQIADEARTLDAAGWWTMGLTAKPDIPTEPLRPVARPQVTPEEHFGQRIWRLCRCIFSRHQSNHH